MKFVLAAIGFLFIGRIGNGRTKVIAVVSVIR